MEKDYEKCVCPICGSKEAGRKEIETGHMYDCKQCRKFILKKDVWENLKDKITENRNAISKGIKAYNETTGNHVEIALGIQGITKQNQMTIEEIIAYGKI